jgi:hypothetical protein
MEFRMELEKILNGSWDLHVHAAPDVIRRKVTDIEMGRRLKARGMKGYAIKSHVSMTTGRAKLVNELYPGFEAVGAIVLNNSVGGINPFAVELAVRDGAKIVWLPTIDALNESRHMACTSDKAKMPFFAKLRMELAEKGKLMDPIAITDKDGLSKKMLDVLDIAIERNVVLATGHIGPEETFILAKECKKRNFKKLVITHPNFPSTSYTKEQQKELADMGAFMEHCFTTPYTKKITWEQAYEEIGYIGPERCLISTDLGQPAYVYPDEGMFEFSKNLLENGFSEEQVRRMTAVNPEYLICG